MADQSTVDWFKTIVVGAALTCMLGFLAWVGTSVNVMSDRLTTIEVTMRENRDERIRQITDLSTRITRLEDERAQRYREAHRQEGRP